MVRAPASLNKVEPMATGNPGTAAQLGHERVPLYVPRTEAEELTNLSECLRTNMLIHGPFVNRFERGIADYVGAAFGVGTNSGTAALHTALLIAGVAAGEEVLITTLTFIAPANAIRYVGAHPVFVDVDPASWQMDPQLVARFFDENCESTPAGLVNRTSGRRIGAIVAVHFLGVPVDLDPLLMLADRHGIPLIEDAAQGLGTLYKGQRVGSRGLIGCFSFYGNKLITAGGGGMIVTNREDLAKRARYLVNQAKDDPVETLHKSIGYNYRMTNLHGAIGCAQLERIDRHIEAKRRIAARYEAALPGQPGLSLLTGGPDSFYTFWLSTILVDKAKFGLTARELMADLREQNIEALPIYQPLHLSEAHSGAQMLGGKVAERLAHDGLSLPSSIGLSDADQDRVIATIMTAGEAARTGRASGRTAR